MTPLRRPFRYGWLLAFGIVAAATVARYHHRSGDLPTYLFGGRRMAAGEAIYAGGQNWAAGEASFTYPPFCALVFVPFAKLPETWQTTAWALASAGALCATFYLLSACVAPLLPERASAKTRALFWGCVALLVGRYVLSIWEVQSNDMLTLPCVVGAAYLLSRGAEKRSGVLAGVAAACKATPILFAPAYLWQCRRSAAIVVGATALGLSLLPDLLAPAASGESWGVAWAEKFLGGLRPGKTVDATGGWPKWSEANQSLAGTIYRLTNPPLPASPDERDVSLWHASPAVTKYATLAAQVAIFGIMLWATRPISATLRLDARDVWSHRFGQATIVATAMPLLSPMSSKSHFGVLLLPVAYCLAELWRRRRDPLVVGLLVVMFITGTLTVKGIVGTAGGRFILGYGTVTICALAAFAAAVRTSLCRRSAWAAAELSAETFATAPSTNPPRARAA